MAVEEIGPLDQRSAIQRARRKAWPEDVAEGVAGGRGRKAWSEGVVGRRARKNPRR